MSEYDLVIRGGTVFDGLRTPRYVADVGIKNGVVTNIGGIRNPGSARVIDAGGSMVAPGRRFIGAGKEGRGDSRSQFWCP